MSQGALNPRVGTRDRTAATHRSMDGPSVGPKAARNAVLFYSPLRPASSEHLLTAASGFPSCPKRSRSSSSSNTSSGSSFLSLPPPVALPASSHSGPLSVPLCIDPLLSADCHANYWGGVFYPRHTINSGVLRGASSTLAAQATALCASGSTTSTCSTSSSTANPMGMQGHCTGTGADSGSMQGGGGVAMFVDSFLPEDDPTLYSLWTGPGNSDSVLGYETESTPHHHHHQEPGPNHAPEAPSSLYLTSDDELKIDYPHLSEFHQDLDSYLNETMESGGPSPTTPLGTHTNCSMKMDRLVTIDRKSGNGHGAQLPMGTRESLLEKSLVSATAAEQLVKRDRATTGLENVSERLMTKSRGGRVDAPCAAVPVGTSSTIEAASREMVASSHWTLPQNSAIEPKKRVELHHDERSPLITAPAATSQTAGASDGTVASTSTVTSTVTSTSAVSGTSSAKAKKRPRSRQCEFPGCQNRARSHQKCKKHGGAHHCVFEGCTKNSQSRGLCIAHGGGSRCKKEGCIRAAQSKGLCKSHGGGEYCAVEGCNKKAHLKHLCRTHGGGVRCRFDKCSKWAQRKGWCMAHAKEFASS